MKRNPRKVKWPKAYRRLHGKDMAQDSTFEFERKRNRPESYDRSLTENTLKAIKIIDKCRAKRQHDHIGKRLERANARNKRREQWSWNRASTYLIIAPGFLKEDPTLTIPKKIKVSVGKPQAEDQTMQE